MDSGYKQTQQHKTKHLTANDRKPFKVANKFVVFITLPLILFITLLGLVFGLQAQRQQDAYIEASQQRLLYQLSSLLAEPIYFFEYQTVKTIVDTAINSSDIKHIHIQDSDGTTISKVGIVKDSSIKKTIVYPDEDNRKHKVGYLIATFNQHDTTHSYLGRYKIPIAIAITSLALLISLLYLVWNKVVSKPLEALRSAMENSDANKGKQLQLYSNDEFESIAHSYNNMLKRLSEHRALSAKSDAQFKMLYHSTPALLFSLDKHSTIIRVSDYLLIKLGYKKSDIIGHSFKKILTRSSHQCLPFSEETMDLPVTIQHVNSQAIPCILSLITEPGDSEMKLGVLSDISNERKAIKKLENLANYDQLTGLLNQNRFKQYTENKIRHSTQCYWLMFIDIDRFKWVNDTYGHTVGDGVIKTIAKRLITSMPNATISRFGGDEFVALVSDSNTNEIKQLIKNIQLHINRSTRINGIEIVPSICIGVSQYPKDAKSYQSLLQKADAAMYKAKLLGRNTNYLYNQSIDDLLNKQNKIISILQTLIAEESIELYFQPIIDVAEQKLASAEVLMRLPCYLDQNNTISISNLIEVAEESGYIRAIDRQVRKKAMQQLSLWNQQNKDIKQLHINVSALNFTSEGFVRELVEDLKFYNLSGQSIVLEITETALMDAPEKANKQLTQLKKLGIGIALDDFGTGHSSLSLLTTISVEILKLDHSFFLPKQDDNNLVVIQHIIAMAQALHMIVIAEGVETAAIAQWLIRNGCNQLQGFLYAKPLPRQEFEDKFLLV